MDIRSLKHLKDLTIIDNVRAYILVGKINKTKIKMRAYRSRSVGRPLRRPRIIRAVSAHQGSIPSVRPVPSVPSVPSMRPVPSMPSVRPMPSIPSMRPLPSSEQINMGWDVHAYTCQMQKVSLEYYQLIISKYGTTLEEKQWDQLQQELYQMYGPKPAFENMKRQYSSGWIRDPQIPEVNFALVLYALWFEISASGEVSLHKHLNEILDDIGQTCIQGVTHRLLASYVGIMNDKMMHSK